MDLLVVNSIRDFSHCTDSIGYPEKGQRITNVWPATAFIGAVARTYGGPKANIEINTWLLLHWGKKRSFGANIELN